MTKFKCDAYQPGSKYHFAHLKRDGMWLEIHKDSHGWVHAYSSQGTSLTSALNHLPWFEKVVKNAPCGTTLWGELWVSGEPASKVKTHLAQRSNKLHFDCFAIPSMRSGFSLYAMHGMAVRIGVNFAPYIQLVDGFDIDPDKIMRQFLSDHGDCEGIVFKNANTEDWAKWKPVKTIDCFVTGWIEGNGKYTGLVGSLLVSVYKAGDNLCEPIEIASVGGFDDTTREFISDSVGSWIKWEYKKVLEVSYQYVGSQGRLRHPRFKTWRTDKQCFECTTNQDPELFSHYHARTV